jgi:hypothetical protein
MLTGRIGHVDALLRQILWERQTSCSHHLFHKTFVASLYGLRTIGLKGVSPGGGESILSDCLSY